MKKYDENIGKPKKTSRKFLEISMKFLEISTKFLEISRKFLEISRKFLEISRNFLEISKNFLEISRNFLEISKNFLGMFSFEAAPRYQTWEPHHLGHHLDCPDHLHGHDLQLRAVLARAPPRTNERIQLLTP